jgi:hypothetical protein
MRKANKTITVCVNSKSPGKARAIIRAGERRGATIPQMAAAILALEATAKALPSIEATRRVPASIAPAVLARNPDFATMSAQDKERVALRGYVGPMELAALITRLERASTAEIVSEGGGITMMKIYDKPPSASAENLATAARLRKLHKVALKHDNALRAPQRAHERKLATINDRAMKIEIRLARAVGKSASDLVAKAALYRSDPERFEGTLACNFSISESLARDVVTMLGWATAVRS